MNDLKKFPNLQVIITCRRNSRVIEDAILEKTDYKVHFMPDDNQMIEINIPLFSDDQICEYIKKMNNSEMLLETFSRMTDLRL